MELQNARQTPLYNSHVRLGGKLVPFAGWALPVQYSGVIPEHNTVRNAAGLFDVSHMGEIIVTGPEAEKALNYLTCNDVSKIYDGKAQYNAITNEAGGVVDDIIVYRFSVGHYLVCVNAANTERAFESLLSNNKFDAEFVNKSADYGQIALQGPQAIKIFSDFSGKSLDDLKPFHFLEMRLNSCDVIVARTGYTGEDGVELFIGWGDTEKIWEGLLESGVAKGLAPAGLGARDSLRLEACYPLHGHELAEDITAVESGLGWIVKPEKDDFIGKEVLAREKSEGSQRTLVGFFVDDPGIVREGSQLVSEEGRSIGHVTSGTRTPTLNKALGLALVNSEFKKIDTKFKAEVRGRQLACHVVKKPFYKAA